MKYPNSSGGQGGPEIYHWTDTGRIEWVQAGVGLLLAAGAMAAWRALSWRVPGWAEATGPVGWWAAQAGVVLGLAVALWVVEALLSRRWGWYQVRVGIVLGVGAAAGYWIVRGAMGALARGG